MIDDVVFAGFLEAQWDEACELASRSDVIDLRPMGPVPPSRVIVDFHCAGFVKTEAGIRIAENHSVGIWFPDDYLRRSCGAGEVLTWLAPAEAYHTNIRAPFCCVGHIPPGMTLVSLIYQIYQMITWQRFTAHEGDALNREACSWARAHIDSFPVDPRRSLLRGKSERQATGG